MKLFKFIQHLFESEATDQAHALNLTSDGFGRWKDQTGKVVAITKDGKLVKVNQSTNSEPERATASEPTPAKPVLTPERPKIKLDPALTSSPSVVNPWENEEDVAIDARYRAPDFFAKPIVASPEQRHRLMTATNAQDIVNIVREIIDVDPAVNLEFYSSEMKEINKQMGNSATGMYDMESKKLMLSDEVSEKLVTMAASGGLGSLLKSIDASSRFAPPPRMYELMALHTVVHESVHSKDKFLGRSRFQWESTARGWALRTTVLEGLTELKARRIMKSLTGQTKNVDLIIYNVGGYGAEVSSMELLEHLEGEELLNRIWNAPDTTARLQLISQTVEKHVKIAMARYLTDAKATIANDSYKQYATPTEHPEEDLKALIAAWQAFEKQFEKSWDSMLWATILPKFLKDLSSGLYVLSVRDLTTILNDWRLEKKEEDETIAKISVPSKEQFVKELENEKNKTIPIRDLPSRRA